MADSVFLFVWRVLPIICMDLLAVCIISFFIALATCSDNLLTYGIVSLTIVLSCLAVLFFFLVWYSETIFWVAAVSESCLHMCFLCFFVLVFGDDYVDPGVWRFFLWFLLSVWRGNEVLSGDIGQCELVFCRSRMILLHCLLHVLWCPRKQCCCPSELYSWMLTFQMAKKQIHIEIFNLANISSTCGWWVGECVWIQNIAWRVQLQNLTFRHQ